jgi:hypothetical protein
MEKENPMLRALRFALLGVALMLVVLGGGAAKARAAQSLTLPDFCASAPPHATLTYGPSSGNPFVFSNGAGYFLNPQGGCYRFLVDVAVLPTNGKPFGLQAGYPSTVLSAFAPPYELLVSQADCGTFVQHMAVYRKVWLFDTAFTRIASAWYTGVWTNYGVCVLTQTSGDDLGLAMYSGTTGASPLGGATYRVAVGVKIAGIWKQVAVQAIGGYY